MSFCFEFLWCFVAIDATQIIPLGPGREEFGDEMNLLLDSHLPLPFSLRNLERRNLGMWRGEGGWNISQRVGDAG